MVCMSLLAGHYFVNPAFYVSWFDELRLRDFSLKRHKTIVQARISDPKPIGTHWDPTGPHCLDLIQGKILKRCPGPVYCGFKFFYGVILNLCA